MTGKSKIIRVANPIYDSVFKYLMEDHRIAKTILSALLKKKVESVEVRRHEYSNGTRDNLSMFRIDFGAQVRDDDGKLRLVLIELQKTWLETETLRFRQYLGTHYANAENVPKANNPKGFALPMVAVYLLGHRVGDIEEPVVYVNHKVYDYVGHEVRRGVPDQFVESLTHDSIIVQIPLLHGQINNRLDKVLSVFDQTQKDRTNRQMLELDETMYEDDEEMLYILRRLTQAASDSKLRQDMNVEDEFFSAIENRDTAILARDKKIKEQNGKIAEQGNKIAEQGNKIAEQGNKIAEQNGKIAEQNGKIAEQDNKITELDNELAEQKAVMRSFVEAMKKNGMSIEEIARISGKEVEFLKGL